MPAAFQRRSVGISHLSSRSCQPSFGLGHPFLCARKLASASAFALASMVLVAQTVMRIRPALKTKRRSFECFPAVYPPRKQERAVSRLTLSRKDCDCESHQSLNADSNGAAFCCRRLSIAFRSCLKISCIWHVSLDHSSAASPEPCRGSWHLQSRRAAGGEDKYPPASFERFTDELRKQMDKLIIGKSAVDT